MPKVVYIAAWKASQVEAAVQMFARGLKIFTVAHRLSKSPQSVIDMMVANNIKPNSDTDAELIRSRLAMRESCTVIPRSERKPRNKKGAAHKQPMVTKWEPVEALPDPVPTRTQAPMTASQLHGCRPQDRLEGVLNKKRFRFETRGGKYYLDGRQTNFFDCIREANRELKRTKQPQIPIPSCMV